MQGGQDAKICRNFSDTYRRKEAKSLGKFMDDPDFFDFMAEGGNELLNSDPCPKCGESIYFDQAIDWVDEEKGICICPHCGEKVKINP